VYAAPYAVRRYRSITGGRTLTDTDITEPTRYQQQMQAAADLLQTALGQLSNTGWVRRNNSTLRHPQGGQKIRHHYTNGVWELRLTCDHEHAKQMSEVLAEPVERLVTWDVRKPLPTVEAILSELRGDSRCWPTKTTILPPVTT
jgi:hypothetical protein